MYHIGIDLGGTNIAVGIVDDSGKIIAKDSIPTYAERDVKEIAADMAAISKHIAANAGIDLSEIKNIGIGCPGSIDSENGIVTYSNNIKMENVPLRDMIAEYFDNIPVHIENDANAAAYGEYVVNGNGADSFVFITLGTGVGGGVIINKKLYRGFNGAGGELGHMTLVSGGIKCTCGKEGCWESYGSVTALIRMTKEAMNENPSSAMNKWTEENGKVSGRTAFDCAKQGDSAAQEVVNRYIRYVADGVVSMVNIFQPDKVVIGGGISAEGEYLIAPVREYAKKYDFNKFMKKPDIEAATLFNDAGIIGAAMI